MNMPSAPASVAEAIKLANLGFKDRSSSGGIITFEKWGITHAVSDVCEGSMDLRDLTHQQDCEDLQSPNGIWKVDHFEVANSPLSFEGTKLSSCYQKWLPFVRDHELSPSLVSISILFWASHRAEDLSPHIPQPLWIARLQSHKFSSKLDALNIACTCFLLLSKWLYLLWHTAGIQGIQQKDFSMPQSQNPYILLILINTHWGSSARCL